MVSTNKLRIFYIFITAVFACISGTITCFAQVEGEETKSVQSEAFITNRPTAKTRERSNLRPSTGTSGKKPNPIKPKKRSYKIVRSSPNKQITKPTKSGKKPINSTPKGMEEVSLGLTVWKIRPATKDDAVKELVEVEQGGKVQNSENTLERMESETPLAIGDKIRLSIESLSRSGYLYVVDRELYDDGTYSVPKLIYPTLRSKNRNIPIGAGNLIFIPKTEFTVKANQTEKKQIAEVLTIIVSPQILIDESMLQEKAIALPLEQFTSWLKQWEVAGDLFELKDGVGQTITLVEQTASQDSAKGLEEESSKLSQDDPTPQSVFRTKIKRENPVLVNHSLKFRSN